MANFQLVSDYFAAMKSLANDLDQVRYTPQQYCDALNMGIWEGYRLRPDMFRGGETTVRNYVPADAPGTILWPQQYATPLVLFATGMLELIDAEGNEDQRAASLLAVFASKLTKVGV